MPLHLFCVHPNSEALSSVITICIFRSFLFVCLFHNPVAECFFFYKSNGLLFQKVCSLWFSSDFITFAELASSIKVKEYLLERAHHFIYASLSSISIVSCSWFHRSLPSRCFDYKFEPGMI